MSLNRTDYLEDIFSLHTNLKEANLVSGDNIYVSLVGDTTVHPERASSGGSRIQTRSSTEPAPKVMNVDMASSSSSEAPIDASANTESDTLENDGGKLIQSVNELLNMMSVGSKSELMFVILNEMLRLRGFRPVSSHWLLRRKKRF